jgi:hypothetical protein
VKTYDIDRGTYDAVYTSDIYYITKRFIGLNALAIKAKLSRKFVLKRLKVKKDEEKFSNNFIFMQRCQA